MPCHCHLEFTTKLLYHIIRPQTAHLPLAVSLFKPGHKDWNWHLFLSAWDSAWLRGLSCSVVHYCLICLASFRILGSSAANKHPSCFIVHLSVMLSTCAHKFKRQVENNIMGFNHLCVCVCACLCVRMHVIFSKSTSLLFSSNSLTIIRSHTNHHSITALDV